MNRKLIIAIVLLVVAAILIVLWQAADFQFFVVDDEATVSQSGVLEERVKRIEKEKGAPLALDEKLALLPARVSHVIKTASEMDAGPVSFHARVVDQHGVPVGGALLRASVAGSMLGGYTSLTVQSDSRGAIQISSSGSGITVMGLQKPGYTFSSSICYFDHEPWCEFSETDYFAAASRQPGEKSWFEHKTPETAYTFKMHKLGYVDGVYAGIIYFVPPRDGGWQTMRMGPNEDASNSPDYVGHLRARVLDRSDDDWKIEIEAVNGGIQLAPKDDAYMSIAPESGYQETFVFECKRDGNCNQGNPRRFYFYSNGGKEYGAMVVSIMQGVGGHYRINTKGNRDLNMSSLEQFNLNR